MSLVPRVLGTNPGKNKKKSSWRRPVLIFVVLLALVLLGTVVVLSSVKYYFGVPQSAFITELEVPWADGLDAIKPLTPTPVEEEDLGSEIVTASDVARRATTRDDEDEPETVEDPEDVETPELPSAEDGSEQWGVDGKGTGGYWMRDDWDGRVHDTHSWQHLNDVKLKEGENIPRIIHQTWKTDTLPPKWRTAWKECREGMEDYEYMLWTDETARQFVSEHYPAHLQMYDNYRYPIQRADSIRYMLLHHFGGVYMDLDIGCRRRMDLLLKGDWEVLLPITKPVGVSNDLIFSSKRSAFMEQTVNGLAAFNHQFVTNYPTVMFSTGPMFLSAQFSIWRSTHASHLVRVLPKSLYGKNAPQEAVPHSFFSHFYGSSWHSDDAGFITWLGVWGKGVMVVGCIVLVVSALRLLISKKQSMRHVLPFGNRNDYQLLPVGVPFDPNGRMSPTSSMGSGPLSPSTETPPDIGSALRRAGNMILAAPAALVASSTNDGRKQRHKGWLYFVPAKFQQPSTGRRRTASEASQLPPRLHRNHAPPPYESVDGTMDEVDAFLKHEGTPTAVPEQDEYEDEDSRVDESPAADWAGDGKWQEWGGEGSGSGTGSGSGSGRGNAK